MYWLVQCDRWRYTNKKDPRSSPQLRHNANSLTSEASQTREHKHIMAILSSDRQSTNHVINEGIGIYKY